MNVTKTLKNLLWISLSLFVFVADRVTKYLVITYLPLAKPIPVLSFFSLFHISNTGAAFSFLNQASYWQIWLFGAIALIVSIFLIVWLIRLPTNKLWLCISLALILGGSLGNLCDRIFYHHVVDFLLFFIKNWSWPAFNIADSAISVGAVMLIIDLFCKEKTIKNMK